MLLVLLKIPDGLMSELSFDARGRFFPYLLLQLLLHLHEKLHTLHQRHLLHPLLHRLMKDMVQKTLSQTQLTFFQANNWQRPPFKADSSAISVPGVGAGADAGVWKVFGLTTQGVANPAD